MVKKHTNRGKTTWCFVFDAPGSSRGERHRIRKFGFASKKEAAAAEAASAPERARMVGATAGQRQVAC